MGCEKKKKYLSTLLFCVILLVVVFWASKVLERKESRIRYQDFMNQTTPLDIIFFGNSHALNTWNPMLLWDEYGIASYNMGNPTEVISTTYWTMQMAFKHAVPKIAVVDLSMIAISNTKVDDHESYIHRGWDAFPLSFMKYTAVNDVFEDKSVIAEMMFPIGKYHGRWQELTREDFAYKEKDISRYKGIIVAQYVETGDYVQPVLTDAIAPEEHLGVGLEYINRIIDLCDSYGVTPIFVNVPYAATEMEQGYVNLVKSVVEPRGIEVLDYLHDNCVDYSTDFQDEFHVNVAGAYKLTKKFGEYVSERYDLNSHKNDDEYNSWDEELDSYIQFRDKYLAISESDAMLLQLCDEDFAAEVFLADNSSWWQDNKKQQLLNNAVNCDVLTLKSGAESVTTSWKDFQLHENTYEVIVVYDNRTEEIVLAKNYCKDDVYNLLEDINQ